MAAQPAIEKAQLRLARHYLEKLHRASESVGRGGTSLLYGLNLFDQESQNIRHWQAQAAQQSADNSEWADLCKAFPLAGHDVLAARIHAADHMIWLESALEATQHLGDDVAQRALLRELIVIYYRLSKIDLLGQFAGQLLQQGEAAHDALSIGYGHDGLGRFAEERGAYAEAEEHYRQALQIFITLGLEAETGRALNGLGSVAFYLGDYHKAYDHFSQHLKLMEAEGTKRQYCSALLAVGDVLIKLKNYAEAEKYLLRAVNLCRALGFQRLLGMGLINLGSWAVVQNQLDLASRYFEEGIEAVCAVGIQRQIIHGLSMLGYTRMRQGQLDAALECLHEGLQMAHALGLPRYVTNLQRNFAYTYLALGNTDAARQSLLESLTIAHELALAPELVKTLTCGVLYWIHMGLHEQAALWVGLLTDNPHLDETLFGSVCCDLEITLGTAQYRDAIERGKALNLENVVAEALALLG